MGARALLFASYGPMNAEACKHGTEAIACELADAFPKRVVVRAYTSEEARRVLETRGERAVSVDEALCGLAAAGIDDAVVQPALIARGESYDSVVMACTRHAGSFRSLALGAPLIDSARDARIVAAILSDRYPLCAHTVLVIVGHGSVGKAGAAFSFLRAAFSELGRDDAYVAALHRDHAPAIVAALPKMTRAIRLVPLFLTAGSHVRKDLLGPQETSWASQLRYAGLDVVESEEGLAELPAIRQLFALHARECRQIIGYPRGDMSQA